MLQTLPPSSTRKTAPAAKKPFGDSSFGDMWRELWPYLWPGDRKDLQLRVFATFALMLLAKFVTIAVPFAFKGATDALTHPGTPHVVAGVILGAFGLTVIYGLLRIGMAFFTQARDAL